MSTRRRVGFSTSSSEASRRQLMQPVPSWEKVWVNSDKAPGATIKVFKWVKTDKIQQFGEDESEVVNQPLAPLPDEPEVVEGDDDLLDADDVPARDSAIPDTTPVSRAGSELAVSKADDESKPASPKPHPLSVSFAPPSPVAIPPEEDVLDEALQPLSTEDDITADISLNLTDMGPDGEAFEGAADMSQLQPADAILGGPLMDENMSDPFAMDQ
ncbi:hypothetical protein EUX98_g9063 [Antrodiella citrinella]|uniref:Uncharacterized protein n=1 Tax=Antrodiella citrinella TaxID=2447956 RepID=A0A4S4LZ23_9APHY|nr:hypothetical protein EUX98_g9063 [Antrodiella citrinella]